MSEEKSSSLNPQEVSARKKLKNQPPEGLPKKPEVGTEVEKFEGPVAWLGGRELIANLKLIALYTIFGNKLDARDWMTGMVCVVEADKAPGSGSRKADANQVYARMEKADVYTRAVETAPATPAATEKSEEGFWFDYIADTGDGQMATYNIAYIAMRSWSLKKRDGKLVSLPRGKFLVIGGDTAYHVADYETLAKRFQAPFWWAYKDLLAEGLISESDRRPLFGIPANHDYYDALDGFNRQFRRPIIGEHDESNAAPIPGGDDKNPRDAQLRLPTFERHQEASYVALHLPFDWWFWGLDTENDEIDFRQQEFFKKVRKGGQPKKLIVATPSPTTVFGQYLKEDKRLAEVFKALGLKRPFLREEGKKERLTQGECRLDLSGDIHHYARYWGPDPGEKEKPRANQRGDRQQDTRYASVVSGGGGAFFDPTNTYFGEIKEQVLFPNEDDSRSAMSEEILDYKKIRSGGSVHYIGAGIAFALCFAVTFVPNTRSLLSTGLGPVTDSIPSLGMVAMALSLLLLILGNIFFGKAFKRIDKFIEDETLKGKDKNQLTASNQTRLMWVVFFLTGGLMAAGIIKFIMYRNVWPIAPFAGSLMVFLTLGWCIAMNIIYLRFTERLNNQAKTRPIIDREFYPTYAMLASPVIAFGAALWFFGKYSLPAYLLADIVFLTVVTASLVGLILFALLIGAERHDWKKAGKVGYLFIGLWHALLQLIVPILWTLGILHLALSIDSKWTSAIFLLPLAYFVFRRLGIIELQRNKRGILLATWIVFGLLMIVPPVLYLFVWVGGPGIEEVLVKLVWWERFAVCLIACGIGAFMSCVWFGWYLAVTMVFNGHNNEAGGAARLEGYKQFIRICLRNDDLTAYVIGFDEARFNGKDLENDGNLRIVDHFELSIK